MSTTTKPLQPKPCIARDIDKIEHRLFSFITMNWRGRPLRTYRTVVELIVATTTRTGLRVQADLDVGSYPLGQKITKSDLAALPIRPPERHGE
jgi:hypothetical protein